MGSRNETASVIWTASCKQLDSQWLSMPLDMATDGGGLPPGSSTHLVLHRQDADPEWEVSLWATVGNAEHPAHGECCANEMRPAVGSSYLSKHHHLAGLGHAPRPGEIDPEIDAAPAARRAAIPTPRQRPRLSAIRHAGYFWGGGYRLWAVGKGP